MRELTHKQKQQLKRELLEAATGGIHNMLRTIRGAQYFGPEVGVYPYDKLTEIRVPNSNGSTYFEVIIKEKR